MENKNELLIFLEFCEDWLLSDIGDGFKVDAGLFNGFCLGKSLEEIHVFLADEEYNKV